MKKKLTYASFIEKAFHSYPFETKRYVYVVCGTFLYKRNKSNDRCVATNAILFDFQKFYKNNRKNLTI